MKAKDYFEKYESLIFTDIREESTTYTSKLVAELSKETTTLYKNRGGKSDSAMVGAIKEINQKWNAICTLFEKKHGMSPLIRNGFLEYWKHKIPELNSLLGKDKKV